MKICICLSPWGKAAISYIAIDSFLSLISHNAHINTYHIKYGWQ